MFQGAPGSVAVSAGALHWSLSAEVARDSKESGSRGTSVFKELRYAMNGRGSIPGGRKNSTLFRSISSEPSIYHLGQSGQDMTLTNQLHLRQIFT
jgi:hypothetical protein